jgi:hypothetical protein
MNVQEFAVLKAGDKIENPMSHSRGEVVEANAKGVAVRWFGVGMAGAGTIRHYSAQSTIWFHWSYAPRDCTAGPCYREDCRRGDQCLGGDYDKIAAGVSNVGPGLDQAISDELANPPAPIMRDAS